MAGDRLVFCEQRGAVTVMTLNDPERRNPFSDLLREQMLRHLEAAMADASTGGIVLTGAGGNFSAGADIRQMKQGEHPDPLRGKRRLKVLQDAIRTIASGPKPVVAAVNGNAFGAGLSVALACDFVIAGKSARFGAAYGKIGLAPDCGILWSLPQRIGTARAKDLLLTGRLVNADEALGIGMIDELVDDGQVVARAIEKAKEYQATAPLTIAATKEALSRMPASLEDALNIEAHQQQLLLFSADHDEARNAFLEKRTPNFKGR